MCSKLQPYRSLVYSRLMYGAAESLALTNPPAENLPGYLLTLDVGWRRCGPARPSMMELLSESDH